jgi:hypothetical protein
MSCAEIHRPHSNNRGVCEYVALTFSNDNYVCIRSMLSPVSPFSSLHVRLLIYSVHSHCQGIIENVDKPLNLETRISCETRFYRPIASTIILRNICISHFILLNFIQIFFKSYVIIGHFNLMD